MQLVNLSEEVTMSSLDFLNNIINPARKAAGEIEVRNNVFIARIQDELEGENLIYKTFVDQKSSNAKSRDREVSGFDLNMDQMLLVGMRESKAVRRAVLARLKEMQSKISKLEEMNQRLANEDELGRLRQQLAQARAAQFRAEDMFYFEHNALMRIEDKKSFQEQAAAAIDSARQAWSARCDVREENIGLQESLLTLREKYRIAIEYVGSDVALLNK